jgi:hypothetical protein
MIGVYARLGLRAVMPACLSLMCFCSAYAADLIRFWDEPQHGGNSFNRLPPDSTYFAALKGYGASWVRLVYDKWQPAGRDFLLGDADNYQGLAQADLTTLKTVVDRANKAGLKVVIAPLSLPYARWSQNNRGEFDDRLWQHKENWQVVARFWRDLASELRGQPGIAAYNIVNEPAPEKKGDLAEHADQAVMVQWYAEHQGGSRDLLGFYEKVIAAIREVDPTTPIMVDAGWYAAADAFGYWPAPLNDKRVLYSFHMYEPYQVTSGQNLRRAKPYTYPGTAPYAGRQEYWDAKRIALYLSLPSRWAKEHGVSPSRMVVGEFGCIRRLDNCVTYLEDVLIKLDREKFHWAFYSFREDDWEAMDYELGKDKVPWQYWEMAEKGLPYFLERKATPEFEPIRKRLKSD